MSGWKPRTGSQRFLVASLAVTLIIAGVVSGYGSGHPDGLQYVAQTAGFLDTEQDSVTAGSPLAGYAVAGVADARLSDGLAGVIGVLVTLLLTGGLAGVARRRRGNAGRG